MLCDGMVLYSITDLIETLWNVKLDTLDNSTFVSGFNRDIVECKENSKNDRNCCSRRFNRDIVECKV